MELYSTSTSGGNESGPVTTGTAPATQATSTRASRNTNEKRTPPTKRISANGKPSKKKTPAASAASAAAVGDNDRPRANRITAEQVALLMAYFHVNNVQEIARGDLHNLVNEMVANPISYCPAGSTLPVDPLNILNKNQIRGQLDKYIGNLSMKKKVGTNFLRLTDAMIDANHSTLDGVNMVHMLGIVYMHFSIIPSYTGLPDILDAFLKRCYSHYGPSQEPQILTIEDQQVIDSLQQIFLDTYVTGYRDIWTPLSDDSQACKIKGPQYLH